MKSTYSFMLLPIMPEEEAAFRCISIAAAAIIQRISVKCITSNICIGVKKLVYTEKLYVYTQIY